MGFDIYGLAPKLKSKQPSIDWEKATDEDKDNYFQKKHKWEQENPGSYFRNNVWWWRPLADLILEECADLITHEQANEIHINSGRRFSKGTSIAIANRLQSLVDSGWIDKHKKEVDARIKIAKKHNEKIEKKLDDLRVVITKLRPNQNLAPNDYPFPYNKRWEEIHNQKDWGESYPFNKENVIEFIKFSKASGGFEIC